MTQDLQLAVELAEQAGRLTLDYFSRKSLQVFTKRDSTPVTEADRKAEELIRKTITSKYPEDGLLGEEFDERPAANNRRWIIDPIDGTIEFAKGLPEYAISLADGRGARSGAGPYRAKRDGADSRSAIASARRFVPLQKNHRSGN